MTPRRRRPLIVGNWKMNLDEDDGRALVGLLRGSIAFDRIDAAVAPAFPALRAVLDAAAGSSLAVAAQNMHWDDRGAFTGEVAPTMLAAMGVRFVLVGHSERRALFGETDATVARKVGAAVRHGLIPILCVGETEAQRVGGATETVVAAQIRAALTQAPRAADAIVVAYEPVWAIGTGRVPQTGDVTSAHEAIRAALADRFGADSAMVRVLYGGSVTAANAAELLSAPSVDGALVGGASLDAGGFAAIAAAAAAC